MKKKLLKDISASTFQVIFNQALGLLIFIITSRYLDKAVYGEFNWSLAILTFITTLLSLRLEQIVVRKVAAGDNASKMLTLFTGHIVFSGLLLYVVLLMGSILFPAFFAAHNLLLMLAISHLLTFFSSPFKQLANGREQFGWLAVMSSTANIVRSIWLAIVVITGSLGIQQVLIVYIISSLAELGLSFYLVRYQMRIPMNRWLMKDYITLMRESLPQIGVVFLNACIARVDWILLGLLSTQVKTAEYSFAYRFFELSPFPLLVLGPVLLSRFSRYFSIHKESSLQEKAGELNLLIRFEMIMATLLPLVLNVLWAPMIDALTNNKYGAVNNLIFLLLSLCIPFQYMINLLWTIHFSQNRLGLILRITTITCSIIVIGDICMIPLLNTKGAAIVYLTAMAVEYIIYCRTSKLPVSRDLWVPLVVCIAIAFASGFLVQYISNNVFIKTILSVIIYFVLLFLTGQLKKEDIAKAKLLVAPARG